MKSTIFGRVITIIISTIFILSGKGLTQELPENRVFGVIQHEVTYFSWRKIETDRWETVFQISVKKRLAENLCSEDNLEYARKRKKVLCEFLGPAHFGFTQKSLWYWGDGWDVQSWPIVETRNNPEIYWRWDNIDRNISESLRISGSVGLEHESNGGTGDASRGWNWLFAQIGTDEEINIVNTGRKFNIDEDTRKLLGVDYPGIRFKYHWPFGLDKINNPDIERFMGTLETKIHLGIKNTGDHFVLGGLPTDQAKKLKLSYVVTWRTHGLHSRNLKNEIMISYADWELWLYIQRWDGTGQWLLDYREKRHSWRIGFVFR